MSGRRRLPFPHAFDGPTEWELRRLVARIQGLALPYLDGGQRLFHHVYRWDLRMSGVHDRRTSWDKAGDEASERNGKCAGSAVPPDPDAYALVVVHL